VEKEEDEGHKEEQLPPHLRYTNSPKPLVDRPGFWLMRSTLEAGAIPAAMEGVTIDTFRSARYFTVTGLFTCSLHYSVLQQSIASNEI
jgi:hypothetical protein